MASIYHTLRRRTTRVWRALGALSAQEQTSERAKARARSFPSLCLLPCLASSFYTRAYTHVCPEDTALKSPSASSRARERAHNAYEYRARSVQRNGARAAALLHHRRDNDKSISRRTAFPGRSRLLGSSVEASRRAAHRQQPILSVSRNVAPRLRSAPTPSARLGSARISKQIIPVPRTRRYVRRKDSLMHGTGARLRLPPLFFSRKRSLSVSLSLFLSDGY